MGKSLGLFFACLLLVNGCNKKWMDEPLKFSYTPQELEALCTDHQTSFKAALDALGAQPLDSVTFAKTALGFEYAMATFSNQINPLLFLKYTSPDATVRSAADKCETSVQQLLVDLYVREDLYARLKAVKEKAKAMPDLDTRLLDEFLVNFKRNGLELDSETRKRFIEKKKRLVLLEAEFAKNLVEWDDALEVTPDELAGLSEDYIAGLKKTPEGKYRITLDYPRYYPFMENAKVADARRRLEFKFNNRGGDKNRLLLEEAIRLRHETAQMLGYSTHAAYVLERRMAKEPAAVVKFLDRLNGKLKLKGAADLEELVKLKDEDVGAASDHRINPWDWRYYDNLLKKKKHQIDHQLIKQYFPIEVVLKGMFEIYETLLSVKFVKEENAIVWHESVQLYRVTDQGKTVAYFYMDLFPREGKYGHAAAFTLQSGYEKPDGGYVVPRSSIVANFNPPSSGSPALMEHSEVETLFHEFGHVMHQVLTKAKYATFSGTNVKTDYVEAPSQMLENWVWEKESLKKLSGHFQDPAKPLPQEHIDRLVAAKLVNSGLRYLRQLSFAKIDMAYHTSPEVDSTAVYTQVMKDVMMIPIQDGTQPQASFGHLMGGYDSGYYSYLWSEVYAQDMYTRFEKEGLLSQKTGADYRRWILEEGGQKPPADLIKGFLGREPNEEAFFKSLGLDPNRTR